jgi:hypothetical protein
MESSNYIKKNKDKPYDEGEKFKFKLSKLNPSLNYSFFILHCLDCIWKANLNQNYIVQT